MSLSTAKLLQTVKKLYQFKFKTNITVLNSLIILQLFAILFSLGGIGERGGTYFNIAYYSADYMIVFTMIWAVVVAMQLMSKEQQNSDFLFVTNRLANHIANGFTLLTFSVIGGITAILTRYLSKLIIHFAFGTVYINEVITPTIAQYVFGVIATVLFVFLFSMIGYTIGAIVQYNKIFILLLPILIIAYFIMSAQTGQSNLLILLFEFYFVESSFLLYLLKIVGTCGFLFSVVTILTNRLEVKI